MKTETTPEEAKALVVQTRQRKLHTTVASTAAEMLQDIHHGKAWPSEWLAERLLADPESLKFQLRISELTETLEHDGYHLTSKGSHGKVWIAEPIDRTDAVARSMNKKAMKLLRRSAVFCNAVLDRHAGVLDESQKRRIEKQAQIQALRFVMLSRLK